MALTYEQVEMSGNEENFCYKKHAYSLQQEVIANWKGKEVRLAILKDKSKAFNPLKRLICLIYGVLLKVCFQNIAARVWLEKGLKGKNVIVVISPANSSPFDNKISIKGKKILNPKNLVLPLSPKENGRLQGLKKNPPIRYPVSPTSKNILRSPRNLKEKININDLFKFSTYVSGKSFEELNFETFERMEVEIERISRIQTSLSSENPLGVQLADALSKLTSQNKAVGLIFEFTALEHQLSSLALNEKLEEMNSFILKPEENVYTNKMEEKQSFILARFQHYLNHKGIPPEKLKDKIYLKTTLQAYRKEIFSTNQTLHRKMKGKKIQWITSSRSAALPLMQRIAQIADKTGKQIFKAPTLVSTSILLHYKLAPLTGELGLGISPVAVNKENLSGMAMKGFETCWAYAQKSRSLFDTQKEIEKILNFDPMLGLSTNRLKIAVLRLILMNQHPTRWPRLKHHIRTKILAKALQAETIFQKSPLEEGWEAKGKLIGIPFPKRGRKINEKEILIKGQIVVIPRSSGERKLGMVCEAAAQEDSYNYTILVEIEGGGKRIYKARKIRIPKDEDLIEIFKGLPNLNSTQTITLKNLLRSQVQEIRKILKLFNQVKPLELSPIQASLIKNSFPLVWASSTINSKNYQLDGKGESLVTGHAELGKDIQFAFTDEKHVDVLKEAVEPYGVTVLTVQEGRYLIG
ncbi:hypothetical protein DB42_CB00030 [Neochlamydia sp. EPS4]|uniref:hypothetical protein n=1 Tax=Neochlamydia sp. EPS4 TaxID=1478175 RepID=UPI000582E17C|nr:hypothetical protein [Neochlamydia sp. EPS4]KIC73455.1 hypothetical protein DB42_CB00030 [Neochlamydia sp. EPS4]